MNKETRATIIKERLQKKFSPLHLEVIDESDQHVGHAGHQGGRRHFYVVIKAECFNHHSRLSAHRDIYALVSDLMPDQIHALRIKII
jgi:BolA protein